MKTNNLKMLSLAALCAALIFLPLKLSSQNAPAGSAQKGQTEFKSDTCSGCHGLSGEGDIAPRIGPPGLAYVDFVKYVRTPEGSMASLNPQQVPDSDLADIYAFLRAKPAPPDAFSAGSGNVQHGKQIFGADGCSQCHGDVGQGSFQTLAPHIGPPMLSVGTFAAYIRRPTNLMPPYTDKVVSNQDVADIYAYLKSVPAPQPVKSIPLLNQ